MGIKSVGDVVATRDTLSVEDVVLDIGFLGTQQIRFRFDLVNGTQQGDPINFLADQTDPACQTLGSAPATTVECAYTRQVVAGQVEQFSFQHRTSRPGPVGFPSVRMTVSVGELSMGQTLRPARVKPEADLVVTVAGPARGQVGEVAMFEWTLANVGLDPVWESAGLVKLTAPAGTEFPPLAQIAVPDDLTCNPRSATKTAISCWFLVVEPGAADARRVSWPLKIVSSRVGEGSVVAQLANMTGVQPEGDFADPTPGNNNAVVRVVVAPSGQPNPGDSVSPSPGDGQLANTGTNTFLVIGIGLVVVLLGAVLVAATRRRMAA
ncbi:LPXTG cell wall anchor domain-containing protein [Catellatospora coxensis]|nr:LPXTG cell wall anchor domain-containing protein [Catellatospora coxensis]